MSGVSEKITNTQRWLITVATMAATLMQVLDSTIVNVALPHVQGSIGAGPDEITWTLTSYMVASAIFMPLTGYFTDRLGRKNYLLVSIIGFTLASALCGAATSIVELVIFRLAQGVFGAGLVPISQAIMTDVFPENERGKAMAIWGTGVMVGPILGPSLGGYLTEIAGWRWTFYVNIPVGIAAAMMVIRYVPDTVKKLRTMNWISMLLISFAIGSIQYILDRGNQRDWLSALDIRVMTFIFVFSFIGFIIYSIRYKSKSVFDLTIFKDRNFTLSCILMASLGLGMFGSMVIQPQMLEGLMNYPVFTAGLMMAPRGVASMISMMVVGKLSKQLDPRLLIAIGILLGALGINLTTHYSQNLSTAWIIWPLLLQGFGLGMIFMPLSMIAFATLPPASRVEAAGIFSLLRTIGASIGISITATFLSRHIQMAWNQIASTITPYNPAVQAYLRPFHLQPDNPRAIGLMMGELAKQAQMLSFVNTFAFIMWSFVFMLPLVFLLKKNTVPSAPSVPAAD